MNADDRLVLELKACVRSGGVNVGEALARAVCRLYDQRDLQTELTTIKALQSACREGVCSQLTPLRGKKGAAAKLSTIASRLASRTPFDSPTCERAVRLWAAALDVASLPPRTRRARASSSPIAPVARPRRRAIKRLLVIAALMLCCVVGAVVGLHERDSGRAVRPAFQRTARALPSSTPTPAAHFGQTGSYPHRATRLLRAIASLEAIGDLGTGKEAAQLRERLNSLSAAERGRTVRARLAVSEVTATEVRLAADASWGWPTNNATTFATDEGAAHSTRLPRSGVLLLKLAASEEAPKTMSLAIGAEIPADVASYLAWNDKPLVEFTIDAVEHIPGAHELGTTILLTISRLRYVDVPENWDQRILQLKITPDLAVWPGRRTFPSEFAALDSLWRIGNHDLRQWNFESFIDYASKTLRRGHAWLTVTEEAAGSVTLDGRLPMQAEEEFPQVTLIGPDGSHEFTVRTAGLRTGVGAAVQVGDRLLVSFEVAEVTGSYHPLGRSKAWVRAANLLVREAIAGDRTQRLAGPSPGIDKPADVISPPSVNAAPQKRIMKKSAARRSFLADGDPNGTDFRSISPDAEVGTSSSPEPSQSRAGRGVTSLSGEESRPPIKHVVEFHLPEHGNDPLRAAIRGEISAGTVVMVVVRGLPVRLRIVRPLAGRRSDASVKFWLAAIVPDQHPQVATSSLK